MLTFQNYYRTAWLARISQLGLGTGSGSVGSRRSMFFLRETKTIEKNAPIARQVITLYWIDIPGESMKSIE